MFKVLEEIQIEVEDPKPIEEALPENFNWKEETVDKKPHSFTRKTLFDVNDDYLLSVL
jgi:hypothetical protein